MQNMENHSLICIRSRTHCKKKACLKDLELGGSPGLVVTGGDWYFKGQGSNPSTVYWMNIFHIYLW